MRTIRGFTGWLFFGLAILALLVFSSQAQAQQDHTCQGGHNCNDGNGSVAVDVATGGDSTRLFSVGGSDMEISGCLATFSWLFGVRQFTKVVPDCEALQEAARLDAEGQHLAAAKMRCGTKLYRKRLGKGQACIDAVILDKPLEVPNLSGLYNQAAQHDERYEQQQEQQQELEQQVEEQAVNYAMFIERFERKERADAAAAKKVRQQKAEDNVYLRGLVNELKALGETADESTQTDD
jgi:hypothetical protein